MPLSELPAKVARGRFRHTDRGPEIALTDCRLLDAA